MKAAMGNAMMAGHWLKATYRNGGSMDKNEQGILPSMIEKTEAEGLHVLYAQHYQAGELVGEYQRMPKKTRLNMYSISKSVVSAGIGLALREGLAAMDELVFKEFEEYLPAQASENIRRIRLRDLLTMSCGLSDPLFFADDPERYQIKDWLSYFFKAEFPHLPGTHFLYSNFNTYVLSCLIEKRCGKNLLEFLRHRLFEPLEIGNPDWTLCPMGHAYAANGLYLTIDELSRFGQMLLHYGNYKGRQIVPEDYLKEATAKQIDLAPEGAATGEGGLLGYGYQFWIPSLPNAFLCDGNYGQYCLVMPDQDALISILSLEGNNYARIREILFDRASLLK